MEKHCILSSIGSDLGGNYIFYACLFDTKCISHHYWDKNINFDIFKIKRN